MVLLLAMTGGSTSVVWCQMVERSDIFKVGVRSSVLFLVQIFRHQLINGVLNGAFDASSGCRQVSVERGPCCIFPLFISALFLRLKTTGRAAAMRADVVGCLVWMSLVSRGASDKPVQKLLTILWNASAYGTRYRVSPPLNPVEMP